ncbi:MAG TPA: hypothetical protein VKD22_08955 [Ramlibacter sp.]|nr:hypothetical protein [Ramlibacter sp.]
MTRIVLNRTAATRCGTIAPGAREAQPSPREATQALDRRSAWPVHRIRWFLLSQPGDACRPRPAGV